MPLSKETPRLTSAHALLANRRAAAAQVNNTDAEGRLTLCDALVYAQRQAGAKKIVDIAKDCCLPDPSMRPDFETIAERFALLLTSEEADPRGGEHAEGRGARGRSERE